MGLRDLCLGVLRGFFSLKSQNLGEDIRNHLVHPLHCNGDVTQAGRAFKISQLHSQAGTG